MTDYQKYINALRKCAKEHENDRTSFAHIRVSDLCRDTANLLEELSSSEKPNKLEIPTSSTTETLISLDVYKQVAKERDIAIQQLHELGYEFGQKIESTTKNDLGVDCISRADARHLIAESFRKNLGITFNKIFKTLYEGVDNLPSVTPQEPRWILVSEKLPKPFTFVNATCRSLVDDRENWVVETIYLPIPKEVNKHGYSDWGNIPMLNGGEAEVIAWVERIIPQPYKAESEK